MRSSTEAELVGADDALPKIIHVKLFIEAQGYKVLRNVLYQDNQATMRLETNGRLSGTPRTKHIKAKYYRIKDQIESGDLEIKFCPTENMYADVLNKPKQGAIFRRNRAMLMNVPVDYDDEIERKSTHPDLLGEEPKITLAPQSKPEDQCRSVLASGGSRSGRRPVGRAPPGGASRPWREPAVTWREPLAAGG